MSAWVLPDHIADVLPSEARHIEELRRKLLDTASGYGYELVMPPLLEHLESLLTGTGEALDLQTFKLVDQLSGRMMGLRADTTPQVARIDAHLLNRQGVARLCYCGPVLHTRPDRPYATREPLQFGAEIYGHAGLEADLEALLLALDCLKATQVGELTVDMADVRIVRALLAGTSLDAAALGRVHAALAAKDSSELAVLARNFPAAVREGLLALVSLYGDEMVLVEAARHLPDLPAVREALSNLKWLSGSPAGRQRQLRSCRPARLRLLQRRAFLHLCAWRQRCAGPWRTVRRSRRGVRAQPAGRGLQPGPEGTGRRRRRVVRCGPPSARHGRTPGQEAAALRAAIASLRSRGEIVVCVLPGHESEVDEFHCDRELASAGGQWIVRAI